MPCLTITEYLEKTGLGLREIVQLSLALDAVLQPVPALCQQGCAVLSGAVCIHGCVSVMSELMKADYRWREVVS